jgi:hypothetical protein
MPYKDKEKAKERSNMRWERWSKRNPEKANSRAREWRQRNPKYMLHSSAKRRAAVKSIEFSIVKEDIPEIPDICPIALIPIFPRNDGTKGPCDNSPSLDRVDTTKGYVKGNLRVLSHKGNRMKADMGIEELERIIKYIRGEV